MLSVSATASFAATARKKRRIASLSARRRSGESTGSSSLLRSAARPSAGRVMVEVLLCGGSGFALRCRLFRGNADRADHGLERRGFVLDDAGEFVGRACDDLQPLGCNLLLDEIRS